MRWSLDRLTRCFVELYVKNFLCANQYILNFLHGLYISYVTQHIIISNALQPSASFFSLCWRNFPSLIGRNARQIQQSRGLS